MVENRCEPKKIEYGEYIVTQSYNCHVMISKGGRMVFHASCNKPMTDDELLGMIGFYECFAGGRGIAD